MITLLFKEYGEGKTKEYSHRKVLKKSKKPKNLNKCWFTFYYSVQSLLPVDIQQKQTHL